MKTLCYSAAMSAILCATSASADITAQQVWDNWSTQMSGYGQTFTTGDETMSGDTLTISDINIEFSDQDVRGLLEMEEIQLTENGDGTVTIVMPDSYPLTIDIDMSSDAPSTANMAIEQDNMIMVVSGEPEAMNYTVSADRYGFRFVSLEGSAADEVDLQDASISILEMEGTYLVETGNLTRTQYEISADALDIDLLLNVVGEDGRVLFNGDVEDLSLSADMSIPLEMDMVSEEPPFVDGFAIDFGYTFDEARYSFDIEGPGGAGSGSLASDNGSLGLAVDIDHMAYSGGSENMVVSLLFPSEFPFPIDASLTRYGFDFLAPLSKSDSPRDARLAFNFTELEVGDVLWNLVDPQEILPRDPVTMAIRVDALLTPFFDLLDPNQQQAMVMADVPVEIDNVDISEIIIRGVGAEITGNGSFTFDETDLVTFDGLPRPEGRMEFAINGVNGLIDNLIQMGLVPEDQAMMPRMMMGMFTTPVGDDMLTSTIEINADGHVLANGQRLR